MPTIDYVEVYLDDKVPETIEGLYRINSITEHLSNGSEKNVSDFFAGDVFHERADVIEFVANHYSISKTMVEIVN